MPESTAIDVALLARLQADTTLQGLLPDGIHWAEAPPDVKQCGIVSLIIAEDHGVFGGRGIESILYLVKAVVFGLDAVPANDAAARIEVLLEDQPLTVATYAGMTCHREERIGYVDVDDRDPLLRWQHRGGPFRVEMSLLLKGAAMAILSGRNGQVLWDPTGGATLVAIVSLNKWKADFKTDKIDVTCFGDQNKVYVPGMKDVSGDISGFWNSADPALFDAADAVTPGMLNLVPSTVEATFFWTGLAYMDASIDTSVDGAPAVTGTWMAAGPW